MKYEVKQCRILEKQELADGIFSFVVDAGVLAQKAKPGQFANILVPGKTLRRPISICEIDTQKQTLRFVLEIRGEGTKILADFEPGQDLDLLAPLGNGFDIGDCGRKALFVGGGIGVPPLLHPAKLFGENATVAVGFRNQEAAILVDDFRKAGCHVLVATDDGSIGHHGLVTEYLAQVQPEVIFACGPMPMLKTVSQFAQEKGIPCQVSLEERMACGIGACLGCACKVRRVSENGEVSETYGHVCKDGPVFDSRNVIF